MKTAYYMSLLRLRSLRTAAIKSLHEAYKENDRSSWIYEKAALATLNQAIWIIQDSERSV